MNIIPKIISGTGLLACIMSLSINLLAKIGNITESSAFLPIIIIILFFGHFIPIFSLSHFFYDSYKEEWILTPALVCFGFFMATLAITMKLFSEMNPIAFGILVFFLALYGDAVEGNEEQETTS